MLINKFRHTIEVGLGSSTGHPEYKGVQTSDIREWIKIDDGGWTRLQHLLSERKILSMIELCDDEVKLIIVLLFITKHCNDEDGCIFSTIKPNYVTEIENNYIIFNDNWIHDEFSCLFDENYNVYKIIGGKKNPNSIDSRQRILLDKPVSIDTKLYVLF